MANDSPIPAQSADVVAEQAAVLIGQLRDWGRVAVAYSGGVDSAVVAMAARLGSGDQAVAVTAISPSLASGELEQACELARQIGIRHELISTQEFGTPDYRRNAGDRCFFCKSELYQQVLARQEELGFDVLINGANTDDLGDHRPGMDAAREHGVRSPLIELGLRKSDVRQLARYWNLPVWDKPAAPCLSSRIAYGVTVTEERVRRVDAAETFLRGLLGVRELRVRLESNELARIELPLAVLPAACERGGEIAAHLKSLGFRYITLDLEGFRSGSLNAVLTTEALRNAWSEQNG